MFCYALDKDNIKVHISDTKDGERYFCQVCNQQVKLIPTHQRQGKTISAHFSHIGKINSQNRDYVPCTDHWHYCMSEWHKEWQERFPANCRECIVSNGTEKHIADVLVNNTVVEFQHSRMSIEEFRERNDFYSSCGYNVIWIFDKSKEISVGTICVDNDNGSRFFWRLVPKFFRKLKVNDEKATILFQFFDVNNDSMPIMTVVKNAYKEFSQFYALHFYSANEFVEQISNGVLPQILTNKKQLEDRKREQISEIKDGYTILDLWKNDYFRIAVENLLTGQEMIIEGRNGEIKREFGKISGKYSNKLSSGEFKYSDKFYCVSDAELPIWKLKHYWERTDLEYKFQKIDDTIHKYRDCSTLIELILHNRSKNLVVECLYNNQVYILSFVDETRYNACKFDTSSGEVLSQKCENYFVYSLQNKKIWNQYRQKDV